jgi:hypothetical protein
MMNAGGENDDDRAVHPPRVDASVLPPSHFHWPSHQREPEEDDVERPFSALEVRVLGLLLARRWLA